MIPAHIGECIVTGDDEECHSKLDVRTCGNVSSNTPAFDNCMSLPKGCISSFHENGRDFGFELGDFHFLLTKNSKTSFCDMSVI